MKQWTSQQVADAAGAGVVAPGAAAAGPERTTIDSRAAGPGALFVGLAGQNVDGGRFARAALGDGAWGVLTTPDHAEPLASTPTTGVVLAADDPLKALQKLATAWRRELGADVIGVTGSTGKTSTKDLLLALLAPHKNTVASRANFNTEIGLPLEILDAPAGTEVLVLEMGMRGARQIAELAEIAEPDVAVIVSIGPVHLELLGSIEAIAAAKAELIAALPAGGTAVIPAGEPLLEPHVRADVTTVTFGAGGDVHLARADARATASRSTPRASGSSWKCCSRRHICAPTCWRRWPLRGLFGCHAVGPGGAGADGRSRPALHDAEPGNSHRRLLQRQPDLDARRPRRPQGHRRRHATARAGSPCWATCWSWGPGSGSSTPSSASRRRPPASTSS